LYKLTIPHPQHLHCITLLHNPSHIYYSTMWFAAYKIHGTVTFCPTFSSPAGLYHV